MPIQRKSRAGKLEWFARITIDGKRIERKAGTKRAAKNLEAKLLAELENALPKRTGTTLYDLFSRHLDHVNARFSSKSYQEKRRVFKAFLSHFEHSRLAHQVTYGEIEEYLNGIAGGVSGHRANKHRIHLVRAYNWGIRALGLPEPNPWRVERYKEEKQPRYVPPEADFWKAHEKGNAQERLMLLLALDLCARKNEILAVTWEDVDFEQSARQPYGKVRLWTNKRDGGREYDWLPMSQRVRDGMREQRYQTGLRQWVFINEDTKTRYTWLSGMIGRLCRKAEVKAFGFHSLRHLGACLLDEAGEPLAYIQMMLRHKNATTTSTYLRSLQGIPKSQRLEKGESAGESPAKLSPANS
jgi:integrase